MLMVSEGSKQTTISSVQNPRKIYLYICCFFPMVRSRVHLLITLTVPRTAYFMRALRTKSEVAQTTATEGGNGRGKPDRLS